MAASKTKIYLNVTLHICVGKWCLYFHVQVHVCLFWHTDACGATAQISVYTVLIWLYMCFVGICICMHIPAVYTFGCMPRLSPLQVDSSLLIIYSRAEAFLEKKIFIQYLQCSKRFIFNQLYWKENKREPRSIPKQNLLAGLCVAEQLIGQTPYF